jgi:tRNA pseudouridine55 synthase
MYAKEQLQEGSLILVDKPLGWSSFQAVNKIKTAIRRKWGLKKIKIGHAGTLDPLATGLLLICTGKFTKKLPAFQQLPKEYTGIFMLGVTTPSYDLETLPNGFFETSHITDERIYLTARQFLGETEQTPPMFSAVKKDGKRLYELARKGKEITIEPRKITLSEFEITAIRFPEVHVRVVCSKGTYIRSLAYDFGKALNSGAYLAALRRTKTGPYRVEDALPPTTVAALLENQA